MDNKPLTKADIVERLQRARAQVHGLGARRIALFGSVLNGQARANSDVDLLVEFEPEMKTFRNFMALCFLLEEVLGRPVDLVTKESLSPYIGPHILREAVDVLSAA